MTAPLQESCPAGPRLALTWLLEPRIWAQGCLDDLRPLLQVAADFLCSCPQVPVQQHLLPDPGLPGGAPAPEHALCCPLGEQALAMPWEEAESAR